MISQAETGLILELLRSRRVTHRYELPEARSVEVSDIHRPDRLVLVTWNGKADDEWPTHFPEARMIQLEMGGQKQQVWFFFGNMLQQWTALLWEAWQLKTSPSSGRLVCG